MHQILKRDGRAVVFDIGKISQAIMKAFEAVHDIDREIDDITRSVLDDMDANYQETMNALKERRRELKKNCRRQVQKLNDILRRIWAARNAGAGRSNTSAVSDKMLLTIPTPPTVVAANRSPRQRGMACGMA